MAIDLLCGLKKMLVMTAFKLELKDKLERWRPFKSEALRHMHKTDHEQWDIVSQNTRENVVVNKTQKLFFRVLF